MKQVNIKAFSFCLLLLSATSYAGVNSDGEMSAAVNNHQEDQSLIQQSSDIIEKLDTKLNQEIKVHVQNIEDSLTDALSNTIAQLAKALTN